VTCMAHAKLYQYHGEMVTVHYLAMQASGGATLCTMRKWLKKMTPQEAVEKAKEVAASSDKCPCGCGGRVGKNKRWANGGACRHRFYSSEAKAGRLKPNSIDVCIWCGEPFPRYKDVPHSMNKETCNVACGNAMRSAMGLGAMRKKGPVKKATTTVKASQRASHCFRQEGARIVRCALYADNWGKKLGCVCQGYRPEGN